MVPAGLSASGTNIFEFDESEGDWFILENGCGGMAEIHWDPLDWAGPHTEGSLLLEADLIDGSNLTSCGIVLQSAEFNGSLPPGTGLLGDFSSGFGAFACWLFVPGTAIVGPEGLKVRLSARTGDAENHPAWGDSVGWDRYDGPWLPLNHGWNRVSVTTDSACHDESGAPVWGSIEHLDVLQALGVEVASDVDQTVSIHVDHYIATTTVAATMESLTWCGIPAYDCNAVDEPFGLYLRFGPPSPDTVFVKGASVSVRWLPHQLELLSILGGDIWDATLSTIDNAQGAAQFDLASYDPQGVRVQAGDPVARFIFLAERSGRAPLWATSIEFRDPENFDIVPDSSSGDLAGDFWYYLGDFTSDLYGGYLWSQCPDRDIDVFDISTFSIHYGLVSSDELFDCRTDIGPTSTGWIHGIPLPDSIIDYSDLAIFAAAYAYQEDEIQSPPPSLPYPWETLRANVVEALERRAHSTPGPRGDIEFYFSPSDSSIFLDDSLWVDVWVDGGVADFKTYQVLMNYDPAVVELLDLKQGPLFFDSPHVTFFRNRSEGDSLDVLDSVMGAGLVAGGPGSIIRLKFRGVGHGISPLHFRVVRPADVEGLAMSTTATDGFIRVIDPTDVSPDESRTGQVTTRVWITPNPTDGSCQIRFAHPEGQAHRGCEIEIFDVRGRFIRSWQLESAPSGISVVEWDGKDGMGRRLPAGVYFAVLRAGLETFHAKVILAN
jgi:hypothetical protein